MVDPAFLFTLIFSPGIIFVVFFHKETSKEKLTAKIIYCLIVFGICYIITKFLGTVL